MARSASPTGTEVRPEEVLALRQRGTCGHRDRLARRRTLSGLRPLGPRDADGLRQGPGPGSLDARRRTTRRSRGLEGEPFVGPAGRLLDQALEEAGIDREASSSPTSSSISSGVPRPEASAGSTSARTARRSAPACPGSSLSSRSSGRRSSCLLGATAAQALLGDDVRVTRDHGKPIESELAPLVLVTIHPSAVLRARGQAARAASMTGLIGDLRVAAKHGG